MAPPTFAEAVQLAKPFVIRRRYILGMRTQPSSPNQFDDWICWVDEDKPETFLAVAGTTDPGTYWLTTPGKTKGTAVVKPGFYALLWGWGKHKGQYEALVQIRPVAVYRDNDRDAICDYGTYESGAVVPVDVGLFGINLHRANSSAKSTRVEKWSAGCQVVADPVDFANLLATLRASGLKEFDYCLVNRMV